MDKNPDLLYSQISDSFNSLYELTTRVDERVKNLAKRQDDLEKKIDSMLFNGIDLESRMRIAESKYNSKEVEDLETGFRELEKKVHSLEFASSGVQDRWKSIVNFGIQLSWVITAAYLLYRLGLQPPAVP